MESHLKNTIMHNMIEYLNFRIKALMDSNAEKDAKIEQLRSFLFESLDPDCSEEYKLIIKSEVWRMAEED